MRVGTLIKVNGRLATVTRDPYTRMVYDAEDFELARHGYEGGSACGFVDVVFNDTGVQHSVNISRNKCEVVS